MSYFPYQNTFTGADMYPRSQYCSNFGDLCSADADCFQSCGMGVNAGSVADGRMVCSGSQYEKDRRMGKCVAAFAAAGDPCAVGIGPVQPVDERSGNTCGPSLYCQQTLEVDARPNTAPSFAAPSVGQGYCMPPPQGRSRMFTQAYKKMA
jgi:hypothetical protein